MSLRRALHAGVVTVMAAAALVLAGCGGGGATASPAPSSTPAPTPAPLPNSVAVVIDGGPPQVFALNVPYTTVRLCAPGSTTRCQTIDHVLVDTGSSGFRVLASVLGSGLAASDLVQSVDATGHALLECSQFVDGYVWGPVKTADLSVGGEQAGAIRIQVIGDPAYPDSLAPTACTSTPGGAENSVVKFGANAVLGVGNYVQDCGPFCALAGSQDGSNYSTCTSAQPVVCSPAAVAVEQQVSNPVAAFGTDNNGVVLKLSAVPAAGAASSDGTLYFGIATRTNNALGAATVYGLDAGTGTLLTRFGGVALPKSYVDSGSNGYFFDDSAIAGCKVQTSFFCPASTLALSAEIQGANGAIVQMPFTVSNADALQASVTVLPSLAGPAGSGSTSAFAWGLPFFLGRSVYVAIEGTTLAGVQAPAVAF